MVGTLVARQRLDDFWIDGQLLSYCEENCIVVVNS